MRSVKAPPGFEGCVAYYDGSRCWKASFRAIGDTWWTLCYLDAGHAHLTEEEVTARAERAIIHALTARGLIAPAALDAGKEGK